VEQPAGAEEKEGEKGIRNSNRIRNKY